MTCVQLNVWSLQNSLVLAYLNLKGSTPKFEIYFFSNIVFFLLFYSTRDLLLIQMIFDNYNLDL
jgi:hypothetical protein